MTRRIATQRLKWFVRTHTERAASTKAARFLRSPILEKEVPGFRFEERLHCRDFCRRKTRGCVLARRACQGRGIEMAGVRIRDDAVGRTVERVKLAETMADADQSADCLGIRGTGYRFMIFGGPATGYVQYL